MPACLPACLAPVQELDEALESAHKAGKALVVFNALTWCRPCKGMQRATQRMAAHYKDSVSAGAEHATQLNSFLLTHHCDLG
jgi:hypothetical protein